MRILNSELETIAVKPSQYPPGNVPEIAFVGRSNVGKSSLLNYLTGRKSLARVSGSPGKTRTINFYRINNGDFRFVDLPGYGYAKVSKDVSKDWGKMMEDFFQARENLRRVIQLVDIRHAPSKQDVQMYEYLRHYNLSGLVCATKGDKVSANEKQKSIALIKKTLNLDSNDKVIVVSSLKKTGADELLDAIGLELVDIES